MILRRLFVTVASDARVARYQGHAEQAGRVHGLVFPRIHLRALAVAPKQPASGQGRYSPQGAKSVTVQLWL